ncbi:hypothetical protein LU11_gp145 [Pseudomonas phage Lu11]|uniref:hypothetical protein n=1 Tax=Pseudomonas phage Lu11 TaxID=1161927 RepID=UPI00025F17B6|nr:hypothetical protein LU11_gp145 [Pseudomonas phage Lu11]AFH14676.1 hypothetical protein Lu11_0143 [Pseudomonas phage Lu11]
MRRGSEGFFWYQAIYTELADDPADDREEVHYFPLEANPKRSNYPALTSIGWFYGRDLPSHISVSIDPLYRVRQIENMRKERGISMVDAFHDAPHFYQESLWAFYASIGYDYKKKKWGVRPEQSVSMTRAQLEEYCLQKDAKYADHP